jgi:hypothetical protein
VAGAAALLLGGVYEALLVGFFFWQASLFVFALGAWALWRKYGVSAGRGLGRSEFDSLKAALQATAVYDRAGGDSASANDGAWDSEAVTILLGTSEKSENGSGIQTKPSGPKQTPRQTGRANDGYSARNASPA